MKEENKLYTYVWKTQAKIPSPHMCVRDTEVCTQREKARIILILLIVLPLLPNWSLKLSFIFHIGQKTEGCEVWWNAARPVPGTE